MHGVARSPTVVVDLRDLVGRGLPAAAVGVRNVSGECRTKCLCVGTDIKRGANTRLTSGAGHPLSRAWGTSTATSDRDLIASPTNSAKGTMSCAWLAASSAAMYASRSSTRIVVHG